jgi:hypothetical protein
MPVDGHHARRANASQTQFSCGVQKWRQQTCANAQLSSNVRKPCKNTKALSRDESLSTLQSIMHHCG